MDRLAFSIILLLGIAQPQPVRKQIVTPASMAGRDLRLLADTMDIAIVRGGVRRGAGTYMTTLSKYNIDGRDVYFAASHDLSVQGVSTFDTLAIVAATFAPLWHRVHAPSDSAAVEFRGASGTGYTAPEKSPRQALNFKLSAGAFESGIAEWIVPSVALQPGYEATIVSFNMWANHEDTTKYRVTGSEALRLRNGRADTWVVRIDHGPDDKAVRLMWIDKATGRTLKTFDAPPRPGASGDGYWKLSRLLAPEPSR